MKKTRILVLCDDLQNHSSSMALTRKIADNLIPKDTHLHICGTKKIPAFDENIDKRFIPQSILSLFDSTRNFDGLIIISSEHDNKISSAMRNALDWITCTRLQSPLKDKPALPLIVSSSPTGGVCAQQQLYQILWSNGASLMAYPPIVIPQCRSKIDMNFSEHEADIQKLSQALIALNEKIREHLSYSFLIWA